MDPKKPEFCLSKFEHDKNNDSALEFNNITLFGDGEFKEPAVSTQDCGDFTCCVHWKMAASAQTTDSHIDSFLNKYEWDGYEAQQMLKHFLKISNPHPQTTERVLKFLAYEFDCYLSKSTHGCISEQVIKEVVKKAHGRLRSATNLRIERVIEGYQSDEQ